MNGIWVFTDPKPWMNIPQWRGKRARHGLFSRKGAKPRRREADCVRRRFIETPTIAVPYIGDRRQLRPAALQFWSEGFTFLLLHFVFFLLFVFDGERVTFRNKLPRHNTDAAPAAWRRPRCRDAPGLRAADTLTRNATHLPRCALFQDPWTFARRREGKPAIGAEQMPHLDGKVFNTIP